VAAHQQVVGHEDQGVQGGRVQVQQEEQEVLLVPGANAVVHPGAVVIHSHNASATGHAVMRPRRTESITSPAYDLHLGVARQRWVALFFLSWVVLHRLGLHQGL